VSDCVLWHAIANVHQHYFEPENLSPPPCNGPRIWFGVWEALRLLQVGCRTEPSQNWIISIMYFDRKNLESTENSFIVTCKRNSWPNLV